MYTCIYRMDTLQQKDVPLDTGADEAPAALELAAPDPDPRFEARILGDKTVLSMPPLTSGALCAHHTIFLVIYKRRLFATCASETVPVYIEDPNYIASPMIEAIWS